MIREMTLEEDSEIDATSNNRELHIRLNFVFETEYFFICMHGFNDSKKEKFERCFLTSRS